LLERLTVGGSRDGTAWRRIWLADPHQPILNYMPRVRHLERFAERAQWRRARGIRGWRARRASRLLVKMAGRGHESAVAEAVWQAWLRKPDDERWELLGQWRSHEALTARVISAATDSFRAEAGRAVLGEFCAKHALVPADPVKQALFLVMTGQQEQHRAADPDGSVLAAAYQAADMYTKAALRKALARSGDLHIVRIVVGQGQGRQLTELTSSDRGSLISQLTARRDWDGLWQLAQDLPLIDAVTAVRHIDGRWRPERQRDRDLFGLLTGVDPDTIALACAATASPVHIKVPGRVRAGALAPDGRRLAVATSPSERSAPDTISVYALPGGALVTRHPTGILGSAVGGLLYSGTTLVATSASLSAAGPFLACFADGEDAEPRVHTVSPIIGAAACRRGFVTVSRDGGIRFHHSDGSAFASHAQPVPHDSLEGPIIAVEPDGGQLAAVINHRLVVMDASNPRSVRQLAQVGGPDFYRYLCFPEPARVIAAIWGSPWRLSRWDFGGAGGWQEPRTATADVPTAVCPVVIAARDEICVLDDWRKDGSRKASYLDAKTLCAVAGRRELTGRYGTLLLSSPDNTWHALGGNWFVDVVTSESMALQGIGDRPQAAWRPADLIAARQAASIAGGNPDTRPWYDLLLACLEHRFGSDVRLGHRVPDPGDAEISIGEGR
jgi:hypothetical protein